MTVHILTIPKYKSLDMENTLPGIVPCMEKLKLARKTISKYGLTVQ